MTFGILKKDSYSMIFLFSYNKIIYTSIELNNSVSVTIADDWIRWNRKPVFNQKFRTVETYEVHYHKVCNFFSDSKKIKHLDTDAMVIAHLYYWNTYRYNKRRMSDLNDSLIFKLRPLMFAQFGNTIWNYFFVWTWIAAFKASIVGLHICSLRVGEIRSSQTSRCKRKVRYFQTFGWW